GEPADAAMPWTIVRGGHELALRQLHDLAHERAIEQRLDVRLFPGPAPGSRFVEGRRRPQSSPCRIDLTHAAVTLDGENGQRRLLDDPPVARLEPRMREPQCRGVARALLPQHTERVEGNRHDANVDLQCDQTITEREMLCRERTLAAG